MIVSLYHHRASWHRGEAMAYEGTLGEFLHEEVGGLESLLRFYEVWDDAHEVPKGFLLVRYEDLHANPAHELRRVLDFVGATDVSDSVVAEAAEFAAFENMRGLEEEGTLQTKALRVRDGDDDEARRVRRGRVGGHVDEMAPDEVAELERRLAAAGSRFGYG